MPNTLCVGVSQQIDQPHVGNLDVSCSLQIDLDEELVLPDSDDCLEKVRQAYIACHEAVTNELHRHRNGAPD